MALSETENEIQIRQGGGHSIAVHDKRKPTWPDTVNRLWFQRLRIAKWVLAGILASAFFAWKLGKFEATVQLMPPDSTPSGLAGLLPALSKASGASSGLVGLAGDMLGAKNTTALFAKVLQSRTVQDSLIDQFNLLKVYGRKYKVDGRKDLQSATAIEEDKKSGVLTIIVRDKVATRAAALANSYVEELNIVLTKTLTSSARRERVFIEQRLADEKKALEDAEQSFSKFSSGSMALDVPEQIRVTVESAARLQGELIAARAELEGLQQIYSPENNRLVTLRARVGELDRQLRKINTGKTSQAGAQDPTFPYPSVRNLPALGVQWADLYRETKVHETVFEMLTQQYEVSRIQEAKEIPTVKVLDGALVPEKRYPRPVWVIFWGTILSAALACGGVLLQDKWETWDVRDPRRVLLSNIYSRVDSVLRQLRQRGVAQSKNTDQDFS